jgi:protein ImuB
MSRLACLDLPALPLQLAQRANADWRNRAVVVVDRDSPRGFVLFANERARASGILPGLRYAAGLSLDAELRAAVLAPDLVRTELTTLTTLLQRFTPSVEVSPFEEEPGVFWLDADGMLRLYPSLEAWAQAVRAAVGAVGLASAIAVGFSRFGSYATVRGLAGRGQVVWTSDEDERLAAARVPLHRVGLDPKVREALDQLGVHRVGQLARLPEAGLLRRFGPRVHRLHQQARGVREEPLTPAAAEVPLTSRLDFDDPVADREALLFFGKQLLDPLLGRLHGRGEALRELTLAMAIAGAPPVTTTLRPAEPTLDAAQLLNLLRLRLELVTLPKGAHALSLEVRGHPATREQLALFLEAKKTRDLAAGDRALARIRAALGDGAVVCARLRSGHLPEAGFTWEPLTHLVAPKPRPPLQRPLMRRLRARPQPLAPRSAHEPDGWLPRGPSHGPVEKLIGPFTISGGWWHTEQQRDYYYAELARGGLCWIYYDRPRRRWFLHGEVA